MRRHFWTTKRLVLAALGIVAVLVLLRWACFPPERVLSPFSCQSLPNAMGFRGDAYTLEMSGDTPIISACQPVGYQNEFTLDDKCALIFFCTPQGDPRVVVPIPTAASANVTSFYNYGRLTWSANHQICTFERWTDTEDRLYLWQDGQWRWSLRLPHYLHSDSVNQPFNSGQVLCFQKREANGKYLLLDRGQIIAHGQFSFDTYRSPSPNDQQLFFTGDGAYCYNEYDATLYCLQQQGDHLHFQPCPQPNNDAIFGTNGTSINELERAIISAKLQWSWICSPTLCQTLNKRGLAIKPDKPDDWPSFTASAVSSDAYGGATNYNTIFVDRLSRRAPWDCPRVSTDRPAHAKVAGNGQSVLLTLNEPSVTERTSPIPRFPLYSEKVSEIKRAYAYRHQGLYEAYADAGRRRARFQLSGVFQRQEYQIREACLLTDGHTILALAGNDHGWVLLRYHW